MFIGHYAAGIALKSVEKKASLGMLFIAAQFVDILYFIFVPLGIEKLNLVENYTAVNHIELIYYPYSHSLLAAFIWGLVIYALWRFVPLFRSARRQSVALVMALAVISHWFIDLLVHTPDLPILADGGLKVGLGLWNHLFAAVGLEVSLVLAAVIYYVKVTEPKGRMGRYAIWIFTVLMLGAYLSTVLAPFDPEMTPDIASYGGLFLYAILAAGAFWVDRTRA